MKSNLRSALQSNGISNSLIKKFLKENIEAYKSVHQLISETGVATHGNFDQKLEHQRNEIMICQVELLVLLLDD